MISDSKINICGRLAITVVVLIITLFFHFFFLSHIYDAASPNIFYKLMQYVVTLVLMGFIGVGAFLIYSIVISFGSLIVWIVTGDFKDTFDCAIDYTKTFFGWIVLFLFGDWDRFKFLRKNKNEDL